MQLVPACANPAWTRSDFWKQCARLRSYLAWSNYTPYVRRKQCASHGTRLVSGQPREPFESRYTKLELLRTGPSSALRGTSVAKLPELCFTQHAEVSELGATSARAEEPLPLQSIRAGASARRCARHQPGSQNGSTTRVRNHFVSAMSGTASHETRRFTNTAHACNLHCK